MQMESSGTRFICANQLLSSSQIRAHLQTSSMLSRMDPLLQSFSDRHLQVKKCFGGRIEVQQPMSTALHILVGHQNAVDLAACAQLHENTSNPLLSRIQWLAAYMETHLKPTDYVCYTDSLLWQLNCFSLRKAIYLQFKCKAETMKPPHGIVCTFYNVLPHESYLVHDRFVTSTQPLEGFEWIA